MPRTPPLGPLALALLVAACDQSAPRAGGASDVVPGRRYTVSSGGAWGCRTAADVDDPGALDTPACTALAGGTPVDVETVDAAGARARVRVSATGTRAWVVLDALAPDVFAPAAAAP